MIKTATLIISIVLVSGTHAIAAESRPDAKSVAPVMAAKADTKPDSERYVADALESRTLPNDEVVIGLISRNRLTQQQFWTNPERALPASVNVFAGGGGSLECIT